MSGCPKLTGSGADRLRESDHRVIITGANGWIGRATLELLYGTLGSEKFGRRVVAFGSSARVIDLGNGVTITQRPLSELGHLEPQPSLVLHLAFLTKDRVSQMSEEDYIRANRNLTDTVLTALDPIGASGIFVASSGAARYANDPDAPAAMRLYGKLKLGDEDVFRRWADQSGGRAVACRIFALSGPHINKHENYALASFILDAISKRPIEIRADHIVRRSYVAIRELMSVVFGLLLDGSSGCTLFDSGGEKMEMQEVAEAVATALGPIPIHRPKIKDGAADDYVGDQLQYDQLLIANAVQAVPFIDQVMETAAFFRTLQDAGVAADAVAC